MANLKEIRGRISSVKNTRKITSAMGRIASARLVKTQNLKTAAQPYGERMQEVVGELVSELAQDGEGPAHPLLREEEKPAATLLVLVTADRGLCGGFNANASRVAYMRADELKAAGQKVTLYCVGKKGAGNLRHRGHETEQLFEAPTLDNAVEIANKVSTAARDLFLKGEVDRVEVVYNDFTNVITQTAKYIPLLPVPAQGSTQEEQAASKDRIFEPSREALLDTLLPMAVDTMVQQTMFHSMASEVAARRTAMDNATDNASQLIDDLTLVYNRERQAAITTELMEIIGGAEALKGS